MRKSILGAALGGALALSTVGMALAGSPKHDAPGTPGTKNCVGQTIAWAAQLSPDNPGLGNLAAALGVSVQDLKALAQAYCNPPVPPS